MGKDKEIEKETELEEEVTEEEIENSSPETEESSGDNSGDDSDKAEKLERELSEQKDKYLRLMAEYDNYRKRTAKQQLETRDAAIGDTVLKIITIYDNFERAAETECSDEKYKTGVEMILKQFKDALDKMNVKVIDPTGEPFDPATANAVSQIEDPELGENVVAQVFEKGVMIGDKVIRYPMVVVANP